MRDAANVVYYTAFAALVIYSVRAELRSVIATKRSEIDERRADVEQRNATMRARLPFYRSIRDDLIREENTNG